MQIQPLNRSGFAYSTEECFQIGCFLCYHDCPYCYNKKTIVTDLFDVEHDVIEANKQIKCFSYTIGEPANYKDEIYENVLRYPTSEWYRHHVKSAGDWFDERVLDELYAVNYDVKGDKDYYDRNGLKMLNSLLENAQKLKDVPIYKEITYPVMPDVNVGESDINMVKKVAELMNTDAIVIFNCVSTLSFKVRSDALLMDEIQDKLKENFKVIRI